jgi:hypothetical protein
MERPFNCSRIELIAPLLSDYLTINDTKKVGWTIATSRHSNRWRGHLQQSIDSSRT